MVETGGIRVAIDLTKFRLTGFIALSAMFGHILAAPAPGIDTLVIGAGVWLLAAGAAVLNHIQDRHYDRWFARTRHRCLVQNRVGVQTAGWVASGLVFSGLVFLAGGLDTHLPWILGVFALVCYNGLYTPLKKKTLFAVWPGVICGMLAPAMGWTAVPQALAHGTRIQLFGVMLVMGIWQVPHFLVLAAAQPVCDPGADRFPSFIRLWTKTELFLQILVWVCVYSLGIFWFLLNGGIVLPGVSASLAGMAFALPGVMGLCVVRFKAHAGAGGFTTLNLSMLIFMVLGILDRILPVVFPLQ
ncbi:MAG: UbiA family prenyltransferase [Desulfotignum sp.]|nr:UbiA family prenyltransferase [Desulfotignum sp.]MCF8089534.1 UbiA family prenyltransferase [Desulfotignum sp.]MCF8136608.1 UbiA family prenyltransferase [Desulfotignum sp.]